MLIGGPEKKTVRTEAGRAKRLAVAPVVLLLLLLLAAGCSNDIFTANGRGVPRAQFAREVSRRLAVTRASNPKELEGSRGQKLKASTEREVATELIRQALIEDQAAKLGVAVGAAAVKQKVEADRAKKGADKFTADLSRQGLTETDYTARVSADMLVDAVGQKVCSGVNVTRDDAESFYLTHKELFGRSLMIHAAHILLDTQGEAEMAADEAKKPGTDFGRLARSISKDTATRVNGGDLGWIARGSMDPAFESAAFGLKSGQVSGVVKASEGYHVIKVLERREASTPSFAECEQDVMRVLLSRRKDEVFSDWLRTVYANAKVNTDGVGRWDPRLGMVVEKK